MELRVKKRGSNVVHAAHRTEGALVSECGAGEQYNGRNRQRPWILSPSEEVTCKRCMKALGTGAAPPEQAKRPESDSKRVSETDPTVVSLLAAGYDDATHNLARMADIVRGWLADDVDPFGIDGMMGIIASKHAR